MSQHPLCAVNGCGRPATIKSTCLCQKHNYRFRKHGSTDLPKRTIVPAAEQIARGLEQGLSEAAEVGECLEWQGKFACKGRTPVIPFRDHDKGYTDNAPVTRLLWERDHGPIPAGHRVYRTCCNNACILHLACGTYKDWKKAQKRKGATKHSAVAKLHLTLAARKRADVTNSMEKAREVRSLAAAKLKRAAISAATGVHPDMVAEIVQGRAWRELGASPWQGLAA